MPPRKRPPQPSRIGRQIRSKRVRTSELTATVPPLPEQTNNNYSLLGMKFDNLYYFDLCLPMGLSSSCNIFEAFSTALEWLSIHRLGASSVLHILDDFLFIAKTKDRCEADLGKFISLCHYLGVPLAPEKPVGPDTVLQFAGITLDSVGREARLPD